ncbi:MAG: PD-(D/E)XK nuclease family protein, partial [Anaerolineales bacterium]
VHGLWRLVQMMKSGREGLVWKDVLTVWRIPYFNWECISSHSTSGFDRDLHLVETRQLEEVARFGRVIRGYSQWEEAFQMLLKLKDGSGESGTPLENGSRGLPGGLQARVLWEKFSAFVNLLDLPDQTARVPDYVSWTLDLLREEGESETGRPGLGVLKCIYEGPADLMERDWQAMSAFVDLLKGYAEADQIIEGKPIPFGRFVDELEALLKQASYQPRAERYDEILCADCTEARGMPFKAVALIGLAEGEFPTTIKEDPLLRDTDRAVLRNLYQLPLQPSTDSAEAEYFYEAIVRTSRYLLVTRPRIAENGSPWESSPYWEELERLVNVTPRILTTQSPVPLKLAASPAEYLEFLAVLGGMEPQSGMTSQGFLDSRLEIIRRAGSIIQLRTDGESSIPGNYEGDLAGLKDILAARFNDDEVWSASRLENYQNCPFTFYIGNLLGLEKLEPPEEGLDGRQLGNIYHRILEDLYLEVGQDYQLEDLLSALPSVANRVFLEAPTREGFRENAWWKQTQAEILGNLRLSLAVIEGLAPEYRFHSAEHRFGIGRSSPDPLEVEVPGEGRFRLRGLIDRVDRSSQGKLRIIDYKTAGPAGFDQRAVGEGKKLQLPLYAMAAENALGLGTVSEGFYFHVQAAQTSSFQMTKFSYQGQNGPRAAMTAAAQHGLSAVRSIRQGKFKPRSPDPGCPSYCPAVDFCWKYKPRFW